MTLRLIEVALRGALDRSRRERAEQAEAAYIGTNATARELDEYRDRLSSPHAAQAMPPEALSGYLRAFSKGMKTMTPAEIFAQRNLQ